VANGVIRAAHEDGRDRYRSWNGRRGRLRFWCGSWLRLWLGLRCNYGSRDRDRSGDRLRLRLRYGYGGGNRYGNRDWYYVRDHRWRQRHALDLGQSLIDYMGTLVMRWH
jgi:hypothetical protein